MTYGSSHPYTSALPRKFGMSVAGLARVPAQSLGDFGYKTNRIFVAVLLLGCLVVAGGCRSTGAPQRKIDRTLKDHAESGSVLFAEGHVKDAIIDYRKAIRRAWAMDNPVESGNNAYNLAACMMSMSRVAEAKDWLVDARVEFYRAGMSAGNTWLLEAKIAQDQSQYDQAAIFLRHAACSDPPCDESECLCAPNDPCQQGCFAKIPCVGSCVEKRKEKDDCEDGFRAQVCLARARWHAEQYDLPRAKCNFCEACELAKDICDYELQADLQNVAAMIHLACGQFFHAGWHFDMEAKNLRLAGNYREIPNTLELAAAAYEQAGRLALASDRLCRVARIWYGRGDVNRAWKYAKLTIPLAEMSGAQSTQIRLALLVHELHQFIEDLEDGEIPQDTTKTVPATVAQALKIREVEFVMIDDLSGSPKLDAIDF